MVIMRSKNSKYASPNYTTQKMQFKTYDSKYLALFFFFEVSQHLALTMYYHGCKFAHDWITISSVRQARTACYL